MYVLTKLVWDLEAYANPRKPFPSQCRRAVNDEVRMLIITNINRWALYGPIDAFTTCIFEVDMKMKERCAVDFLIEIGKPVACGSIFGLYSVIANIKNKIASPTKTQNAMPRLCHCVAPEEEEEKVSFPFT